MHRLSSITFLLFVTWQSFGQSPHGESFKMDCAACHSPENWTTLVSEMSFDHDETSFPLDGVHLETDCKSCHTSLVFEEASSDCISCHQDVHSQSVGNDCMRCHNTESWLVDHIPELHEQNGFPLMGAHSGLSCMECHTSETNLRFDRVGNDCYSCHTEEYASVQSPNHVEIGFSLNCVECHDPTGFSWATEHNSHSFFPLRGGHDLADCNACHTPGTTSGLSPECVNCHLQEYQSTASPNHQSLGFSDDCAACHDLSPGWRPANWFGHDSRYFPIYSGPHRGEWNRCTDCHLTPNDYSTFSCTVCHGKNDTDGEHGGVNGYIYESNACLQCHPDGRE